MNNSEMLGIVRLEKYYDKQVKKIKARLNEKTAKIRLPEKYPFNKVYNNGKVIHREGYQRFFDGISVKRYNKYDYTGGTKW